MDGKPGLFHLLGQRMDWLGQRQKVLAQNIANADTPEYVPHDLKPQEFRRMVERNFAPSLKPVATQGGHIQTSSLKADDRGVEEGVRSLGLATPDSHANFSWIGGVGIKLPCSHKVAYRGKPVNDARNSD